MQLQRHQSRTPETTTTETTVLVMTAKNDDTSNDGIRNTAP
ncbi:6583_t:CDS:1, partial [Gigaspora rosea]